ncbi:MAG: hypothetical protein WA175_09050 [Candidatus Acidiferrales bacterium]
MRCQKHRGPFPLVFRLGTLFAFGLLLAPGGLAQSSSGNNANSQDQPASKDNKKQESSGPPTTKLRIHVQGNNGKPIGNASIYVRFDQPGGFLHHEKHIEMNFRTNEDGSVKVPPIPQGKILIQVIATGWRTYGKYYDVEQDEESVEITLDTPPHWY